MYGFISGALTMGYAVAGLFFLRYWRATGDRLFGWFSTAFWVLAAQRFVLVATRSHTPHGTEEHAAVFYIIRLLAFVLILLAIIDKNRVRQRP